VNRKLQKLLRTYYSRELTNVLEFGSMSCEMIGEWMLSMVPSLYKVEVWEDWENGAIIER
jgi:hypothetical protein